MSVVWQLTYGSNLAILNWPRTHTSTVHQGPDRVALPFINGTYASAHTHTHARTRTHIYTHTSCHGCQWINWNWTQIQLNSSLSGTYLSTFSIELVGVKTNREKSAQNLGSNTWQKFHFPLTYTCGLQLMLLPHLGSVVYSQLPWSE